MNKNLNRKPSPRNNIHTENTSIRHSGKEEVTPKSRQLEKTISKYANSSSKSVPNQNVYKYVNNNIS